MPVVKKAEPDIIFRFGEMKLWIDRVENLNQAEIWLEIETDDLEAAALYLECRKITRRDEIEPLPEGFRGLWIANPAEIIHLVRG